MVIAVPLIKILSGTNWLWSRKNIYSEAKTPAPPPPSNEAAAKP
jgi:hypothetical protein